MTTVTRLVLTIAAGAAMTSGSCSASATDRSVSTARTVRATAGETHDAVYMATRPDLFQGKAVRVYCEHLRNPDAESMTCRANRISIIVDTKLLSAPTLRHVYENCQGMMSNCSGTVSGVAQFVRGVPYIAQADVEFLSE